MWLDSTTFLLQKVLSLSTAKTALLSALDSSRPANVSYSARIYGSKEAHGKLYESPFKVPQTAHPPDYEE